LREVVSSWRGSAAIERYITSQYADLAPVMKETPMAAGNVLDHTLVYGVSELAVPQGMVMTDFGFVLMGLAGGKVPGNRHLRLVGRKVTELMLTMQQIMGVDVTTFGSWDRTSATMPEILARRRDARALPSGPRSGVQGSRAYQAR
jgi:hypothetical protein